MRGTRAVAVIAAVLIGLSSLIARVPATAAALSDGPVLVETDSNVRLECSLNGGEWSTITNECVTEQPG
jgi:hypothetical protein